MTLSPVMINKETSKQSRNINIPPDLPTHDSEHAEQNKSIQHKVIKKITTHKEESKNSEDRNCTNENNGIIETTIHEESTSFASSSIEDQSRQQQYEPNNVTNVLEALTTPDSNNTHTQWVDEPFHEFWPPLHIAFNIPIDLLKREMEPILDTIPDTDLFYVDYNRMHVTVLEIDQGQPCDYDQVLRQVEGRQFWMRLSGFGTFPPHSSHAQFLYIGVEVLGPHLLNLHNSICSHLDNADMYYIHREEYTPHCTVMKNRWAKQTPTIHDFLTREPPPLFLSSYFLVSDFRLTTIEYDEHGTPRDRVLQKYPLKTINGYSKVCVPETDESLLHPDEDTQTY